MRPDKFFNYYDELTNIFHRAESAEDLKLFQEKLGAAISDGYPIDYSPPKYDMPLLRFVIRRAGDKERYKKDKEAMVHVLLELGADPNIIDYKGDDALLHATVMWTGLPAYKAILERTTDINRKSHDGYTPLSQLCEYYICLAFSPRWREETYRKLTLLLDAGADPKLIKNEQSTILDHQISATVDWEIKKDEWERLKEFANSYLPYKREIKAALDADTEAFER